MEPTKTFKTAYYKQFGFIDQGILKNYYDYVETSVLTIKSKKEGEKQIIHFYAGLDSLMHKGLPIEKYNQLNPLLEKKISAKGGEGLILLHRNALLETIFDYIREQNKRGYTVSMKHKTVSVYLTKTIEIK